MSSNNETETAEIEVSDSPAQTKEVKPDFGNGRYSRIMGIAYDDAKRVIGLEPNLAEKYARAFGADLGRARITPDSMSSLKFGKVDKDGYTKIRESAKSTSVKFSYPFELNRLIVGLDDLRHSVLQVVPYFTVQLADHLQEWLEEPEKEAKPDTSEEA